ncbi:hypothetical protein P152DRAFT_371754, partial [Eremomyces bilateralis CBS 781.70]
LPPDFLTSPPSQRTTLTPIHFPDTPLPGYAGCLAFTLDGVLSPDECAELVALAESHSRAGPGQWERAMVNAGSHEIMATDIRNCGRIIWDDREVVARVWDRCLVALEREKEWLERVVVVDGEKKGTAKPSGDRVLEYLDKGYKWSFSRLNERMRFLRYGKGEYFQAHQDGQYHTPDRSETSLLTLQLYLNDAETEVAAGREPLVGGATTFHSWDLLRHHDVVPKVGRVLIFQHQMLVHSGAEVKKGMKIAMRTDLMYRK